MDARACLPALLIAPAALLAPAAIQAQPARADAPAADEELIATLRTNGVDRGEFTLVRTPDGDFWLAEGDLARLKLKPVETARRRFQRSTLYSLRALGATHLSFDEATLSVVADFPVARLEGTQIDLSNRLPPPEITRPQNSTIVNYRAGVRQAAENLPVQLRLSTDLNMRVGEVLFRQEARFENHRKAPSFSRGWTQLVWDDRLGGRRVLAGDQLTAGGPFGSSFSAAGISVTRVFAITPELVRQPTASVQVSAPTPAQVEVSVDGNLVHRSTVQPGPISLDNLFYYGGTRTVRVVVTDLTGRRQVIEQPFLFTDSVLAKGLQEYSYFFGRRSELRSDDQWHYRETAWQGFHRYGLTDRVTLEGSAEGSSDFASGGGGITLRHDRLGLLSFGALHSTDRAASRDAQGWALRYTYVSPQLTLFAGRRRLEPGFRSFSTGPNGTSLLGETRLGAAFSLSQTANLSLDYGRTEERDGPRSSYTARFSSALNRQASLLAEYTTSRDASDRRDWRFNVYLRLNMDRQHWAGATYRTERDGRSLDVEGGKEVGQDEGFGYRVGSTVSNFAERESAVTFGSATWNLRQATVDVNALSQVRGGSARYLEAAVSGAVVALDGYVGATRLVGDSFALARLGVPQAGVDVFLNNQRQGQTDAQGNLLLPNVGAFGRQDVSLNDRQLPMEYNLATKRVVIAPAYRSGTAVDFGAQKLRAVTGQAWLLRGGERKPVETRSFSVSGGAATLQVETATAGEFYLEDAPPGRYAGKLELDGRAYSCRMNIPSFTEAVHELREGLVCE